MEVKRKVLVVDDDAEIVTLLRLGLEKYGFEVISGSNGEEAIELTRKHEPDLILLDIMMPDMDGFEACKTIKLETTKFIPIIFVTAKGTLSELIEGLTIADDYLPKPFSLQEVIARVRSMMRTKDLTEKLEKLTQAATIDATAVMINHRINNPLTTITLQIDMIKTKLSPDNFKVIKPYLDDITGAATMIHQTAYKLAEIARKPEFIKYKEYIDGVQMIDVDHLDSETENSSS